MLFILLVWDYVILTVVLSVNSTHLSRSRYKSFVGLFFIFYTSVARRVFNRLLVWMARITDLNQRSSVKSTCFTFSLSYRPLKSTCNCINLFFPSRQILLDLVGVWRVLISDPVFATSEATTGTFVLKSPWSPRAEVIGDSERFTLLAGTLKKGGKAASGTPRLIWLGKGCRTVCRRCYLRDILPAEVTGLSSWKWVKDIRLLELTS